jgi:cysteine desulfurase/selenocysteine lyase
MTEYYTEYGVNIHRGVYNLSYKATDEYDIARQKVADFINADFKEVVFTKNVTEALNKICLMYSKKLSKDAEVITTQLEHHSSVLPWQNACKENGFKLTYLPLNKEGRITVDNFKKVISKNSKVLAITYVSNVLGYITPLEEIIRIAHEHNMIVIVDAAQAVPHMKIDVKKLDCDFLAFSGHKMFGPTGVGVLYGKANILKTLDPVEYGGDMNEEVDLFSVSVKDIPSRFEAGTPMIAEAIGLGAAVDFINELGYDNIQEHEHKLLVYALDKLKDVKGVTIYNINSDIAVISFNIDDVHPHDAATLFDEREICVRAGHHCAQLVTKWLKCSGTLRASFYIYNDYNDIDKFVQTIKDTVEFFDKFKEV